MARRPRGRAQSGIYHVMLRGNAGEAVFAGDDDKYRILNTLQAVQELSGFRLYAYCVMDNHVHLLLREGRETVSKVVQRVATRYARYYNFTREREGHVFQGRFASERVEDESYLFTVIRYIHNNPVRAQLADAPGKWRWSSFLHYFHAGMAYREMTSPGEILAMMDGDPRRARAIFAAFSMEKLPEDFDDMPDVLPLSTRTEAVEYDRSRLAALLRELLGEWTGGTDTIPADIRKAVIARVRQRMRVSGRKLAQWLGVRPEVVYRDWKEAAGQ